MIRPVSSRSSIATRLACCAAALLLASAPLSGIANTLVWNNGTGSFTGGQTWSYDDNGVLATTDNPFTLIGAGGGSGGENVVLVGNGGDVTLNVANQGPFNDNSLAELRIGTLAPEADLSGLAGGANYQGDGTLTVDNVPLVLFEDANLGTTGNLIVGGASGITGALNWNSTQTLNANGQLRVGQGGVGTLNQNGGSALIAAFAGSSPNSQVGSAGGTGVYNLNDGSLQFGTDDDGLTGLEKVIPLQVGQGGGSMGTFNLGDGSGAANSATVSTWANVALGGGGGTGTLNLASDGELVVNYASAQASSSQIFVGVEGGENTGEINQTGGRLFSDGLLRMGFNLATATYSLNGSSGSVNVRALEAFQNATFNFDLDAGGATTVNVDGNTNTAGDVASGNSITFSNPTLNVTGLGNYNSTSDIVLFNQADPTASLSGSFGNLIQGAVVGQNQGGQDFFLNLFGGDGNDIVLQNTLPSSSTDGLVWNTGAANFDAGWASGDGSFGVGAFPVDPFSGLQSLYLGNNGAATLDNTTNTSSGTTIQNLFIGTNAAAAVVGGRNGDGALTVNGSQSLTVDDSGAAGAEGMLIVGDQGFTGTMTWSSTGTLDVQGQFRVGRNGGTGVVNQNDGVVQGGTTGGGGKYLGVGDGAGSDGTYNLNNGTVYPDGVGAGSPLRQFRVGHNGATGRLHVGDGTGASETAVFESEDDLWVGSQGGSGTLTIDSDGAVRLLGDSAQFLVGNTGGATNGLVVQDGGVVVSEALISIGQGAGATGEYQFNGGVIQAANDGGGDVRVGGGGGDGTLRISGAADFSTQGNFFIAEAGGSGAVGLLELSGSQASFVVNELENAPGTVGAGLGNDETIRWIADASGITPIVVTGVTGGDFVQLQDPQEVAANTGTNGGGDLTGDGIALDLDLSALAGTQTLTLVDNQSVEAVVGFFEDGSSMDLYEEGESILGTGFGGSVTISYVGGTGNDVVLSLIGGTALFGDYNDDGVVDAVDYIVWRENLGANITLPGEDPSQTPGQVTNEDYIVWRDNYGNSNQGNAQAVPEPGTATIAIVLHLASWLAGGRRTPRKQ